MPIYIKLAEVLEEAGISRNTLAREAKIRPNTIYDMHDNKTKRIDLVMLTNLLDALCELTGQEYQVSDIFEYRKGKQKEDNS
ncbi:helix-turn-helix transcriptional regulator [Paenibacillus sp. PK4536]|uniref:helix-turn-helix domain-containing protein n=1 Tax=Paenibacillus sp. PK4536 TaxID=3024576 RepID=UPI002359B48C|nr:helix-turn-helix transcriptional regulator [Paenibacillus sp. PK4536]WIM38047.1 helix-turn-helix transcriptional regulator [Paenibacillus sp. PK4536]